MNINGMARSYMAKIKNGEDFLKHVAGMVESQLKEWDDAYEVIIMKLQNYEWIIKKDDLNYRFEITEVELQLLQNKSPYALDTKVWRELEMQGLPIIRGMGNYIDFVLDGK